MSQAVTCQCYLCPINIFVTASLPPPLNLMPSVQLTREIKVLNDLAKFSVHWVPNEVPDKFFRIKDALIDSTSPRHFLPDTSKCTAFRVKRLQANDSAIFQLLWSRFLFWWWFNPHACIIRQNVINHTWIYSIWYMYYSKQMFCELFIIRKVHLTC